MSCLYDVLYHLRNLKAVCHFPGGRQFEWFIGINAEVEVKAVPGIKVGIFSSQNLKRKL